jgi:hypothetical protein
MAKLKKSRIRKEICDVCNGNGFVKITDPEDSREINIHQCWECDSEGEYYVYKSKMVGDNNTADIDNSNDKLLH